MTERLQALLVNGKEKKGFVFSGIREKSMSPDTAGRHLQMICREAGVKKIGWHILRHTFATRLAERGALIVSIKEQLGHTSIEMTMRYSHMSSSVVKKFYRFTQLK